MSDDEILEAFADAFEAAAKSLRKRATHLKHSPGGSGTAPMVPATASARAKAIHPSLGPRQSQIVDELERAGKVGTNTGVIYRAIGYTQPNVHLTLKHLIALGFAEKDETTHPQTYRLSDTLADWDEEHDAA